MTIARYALLDALDSQFIRPKPQIDVLSVAYSIYVMQLDSNIKKYCLESIQQLKNDAVAWANSKKTVKWLNKNMAKICEVILGQLKAIYYMIPDISSEDQSTKTSNGWIAQLAYTSIKDFNISLDDTIYNVPLATIMLMFRQKHYNDSKGKAMTLQDKELIDSMEK